MTNFYTNVSRRGDKILCRAIINDERKQFEVDFQPTLFVPNKIGKQGDWKTLEGQYVEPIQPGTMSDCREFIDKYKSINNFSVYGNTDYIYQFIGELHPNEVEYDIDKLHIAYFDIETTCEHGFPQVEDPIEQINAITIIVNDRTYVVGLGQFNISQQDALLENQYQCETEEELLRTFIEIWEKESPDIITGWNTKFFDIPYLVSRCNKVLGKKQTNRLSPWGRISKRTVKKMNYELPVYIIEGISSLDYLDLYQKFTYTNQESYRLDHIAFVELGKRKLSYEEFDNLSDFYKNDFQKFMEYNVKDTQLILELESKLKLIELAVAMAYSAKVNIPDVFSQVRTWDQIIYHHLTSEKIVIPMKKTSYKDSKYAGAYVKEPIIGNHDWVVSLDLNSLYPHLIMQYNISPETKINQQKDYLITPDSVLGEQSEHFKKALKTHIDKNYSVAANGTCYTREKQGFLPALMEKMYEERKMYKKKMIECQKHRQNVSTMSTPSCAKAGIAKKLDYEISKYYNFQQVRKIQLNSAYGAIGSEWFRYYDVEMAEAITISGQLNIRWIANKLNEFLNETLNTGEYDYVVASDTDSVYLRLSNLVNRFCDESKTKQEMVEFLNKATEEIILPFVKKQYDILGNTMNVFENKMVMDRECIADRGIWTAKKRYMMNVYDSEGVRYKTPKLKIMGIETTRSSTPLVVREKLKETIKLILTTDEQTVIKFIEDFKTEFFKYDVEDIAFPRGVNGLDRYIDDSTIYRKSTPIAVKGALIYNYWIKDKKLDKKYQKINEGDKIKFLYLKIPNPIHDKVISFAGSLPKELKLHDFVNYEEQFKKTFLDPIKHILDAIGWHTEKVSTLESLFA